MNPGKSQRSSCPRSGRVVYWLVAVVLLAAVISASVGIAVRRNGLPSTPDTRSAQGAHGPIQTEPKALAALPPLPDARTPRPATSEELIKEVNTVLENAVREFPESVDCMELQARVQDWLGNGSEAERIRKRCLELSPRYAYAYYGLAEIAAKRGDSGKAAELASKALELAPGLSQARITAAEAFLRSGRPDSALTVLGGDDRPEMGGQEFLLRGQAYLQLEQFEKALENFRIAVEKGPELANAFYGMSQAHNRLGEREKAKATLDTYRERLLAISTKGLLRGTKSIDLEKMLETAVTFYTHAGQVYASQDRRSEAEQLWLRAEALSSKDAESRRELVKLYRAAGKPQEALRRLEELAKLEPKNAEPWLLIGEIQAAVNQLEAAERALRRACEIAPDSANYVEALAVFYVQTNRRLSDALPLARRAVELHPTPANYSLLAVTAFRNGQRADALAAIKQAVALEPQNLKYQQMLTAIQSGSP